MPPKKSGARVRIEHADLGAGRADCTVDFPEDPRGYPRGVMNALCQSLIYEARGYCLEVDEAELSEGVRVNYQALLLSIARSRIYWTAPPQPFTAADGTARMVLDRTNDTREDMVVTTGMFVAEDLPDGAAMAPLAFDTGLLVLPPGQRARVSATLRLRRIPESEVNACCPVRTNPTALHPQCLEDPDAMPHAGWRLSFTAIDGRPARDVLLSVLGSEDREDGLVGMFLRASTARLDWTAPETGGARAVATFHDDREPAVEFFQEYLLDVVSWALGRDAPANAVRGATAVARNARKDFAIVLSDVAPDAAPGVWRDACQHLADAYEDLARAVRAAKPEVYPQALPKRPADPPGGGMREDPDPLRDNDAPAIRARAMDTAPEVCVTCGVAIHKLVDLYQRHVASDRVRYVSGYEEDIAAGAVRPPTSIMFGVDRDAAVAHMIEMMTPEEREYYMSTVFHERSRKTYCCMRYYLYDSLAH